MTLRQAEDMGVVGRREYILHQIQNSNPQTIVKKGQRYEFGWEMKTLTAMPHC